MAKAVLSDILNELYEHPIFKSAFVEYLDMMKAGSSVRPSAERLMEIFTEIDRTLKDNPQILHSTIDNYSTIDIPAACTEGTIGQKDVPAARKIDLKSDIVHNMILGMYNNFLHEGASGVNSLVELNNSVKMVPLHTLMDMVSHMAGELSRQFEETLSSIHANIVHIKQPHIIEDNTGEGSKSLS